MIPFRRDSFKLIDKPSNPPFVSQDFVVMNMCCVLENSISRANSKERQCEEGGSLVVIPLWIVVFTRIPLDAMLVLGR